MSRTSGQHGILLVHVARFLGLVDTLFRRARIVFLELAPEWQHARHVPGLDDALGKQVMTLQ